MAGKNTAAFGIYPSGQDAERGADALIQAGFSRSDISVLMPDSRSTREFAAEKNTKAPEGTTTGCPRQRFSVIEVAVPSHALLHRDPRTPEVSGEELIPIEGEPQ